MFRRDSFPQEIYLRIFSFFNPSDLSKISEVCKLFRQLANDNALWNKFLTRYLKTLPENVSYKQAYVQLYKKYFHFLNLPGNNYLQYLVDNQLSLDELTSVIHPCKGGSLEQSPFDGLWLDKDRAPKPRNPSISIIDLQPNPPMWNGIPQGAVTAFSLSDFGIDIFNMEHINKHSYDENNWQWQSDNAYMKWSSCFVIETNAVRPLINFVTRLAERLGGKHHLPNLVILTKDNHSNEFINELHRLKINIAAILPGSINIYNLHLLKKSNLKSLSIDERNILTVIQFLTKVSRDMENIAAPTFEKPSEHKCQMM